MNAVTTTIATSYTCGVWTDVRGTCGHSHRTLVAAKRCLAKDQAGCESQGGYSDRLVRDQDGVVVFED